SGRPTTPATATPRTGSASVTHGRPHLGGPLTDFVGKYGTPDNQGDASGLNFWTGADQSIDLNINSDDQGSVTQVIVLGSSTWTTSQTQSYCQQFLPDGATQTGSSANLLTYSSRAGTVDLKLSSTTSCSISFARS